MQTKLSTYLFLVLLALPFAGIAQDAVIPLWPNGAPGFENRRNEPEQAKDYWVKNIHNPSLTVFLPPKAKQTARQWSYARAEVTGFGLYCRRC
jgi:hypothetical protein